MGEEGIEASDMIIGGFYKANAHIASAYGVHCCEGMLDVILIPGDLTCMCVFLMDPIILE